MKYLKWHLSVRYQDQDSPPIFPATHSPCFHRNLCVIINGSIVQCDNTLTFFCHHSSGRDTLVQRLGGFPSGALPIGGAIGFRSSAPAASSRRPWRRLHERREAQRHRRPKHGRCGSGRWRPHPHGQHRRMHDALRKMRNRRMRIRPSRQRHARFGQYQSNGAG